MARAVIELRGEDVFCSVEGGGREARLAFGDAAGNLKSWALRYETAASRNNEEGLAAIGREMFAWLDEAGWATVWADRYGDRDLEIRVQGRGEARETVLLDAPWELLGRDSGPLALDDVRPFIVARRIGPPAEAWRAQHRDLRLMFMAAAPEGEAELDFEREEAAILEATRDDQRVQVVVEETGTLGFMGGRLASEEGPFEAVHLSGHGDITPDGGPVLLLERPEGGAERVGPGDLIAGLGPVAVPGPRRLPLIFLSACRTAEIGRAGADGGAGRREASGSLENDEPRRDLGRRYGAGGVDLAAGFARQLAMQFGNVVGWDGSVYDRDATDFARVFYRQLGLGSPVPRAAALARSALLKTHREDPRRGRHWHMARVYLGADGGGPLCDATKPKREDPAALSGRVFLDEGRKRVQVAKRAEFVGRRRAIQAVLRAFRDGRGVLVHGMGALGKSSLAARVTSRSGRRSVVIYERYDALEIFDQVVEALKPEQRPTEQASWRERVKADAACLGEALERWLTKLLHASPILLIIDDLERILEKPAPGDLNAAVSVKQDYRAALEAVLRAFSRAQTDSRLLLTSRYVFRLPDASGRDRAAGLVRVPLAPMPARERVKQLRAAERAMDREGAPRSATMEAQLERALTAAAGNPWLQKILTRPILAGEIAASEQALSQIAIYRETGEPPAEVAALMAAGVADDSDNALIAFFARLSFETYRAALSADQARQLAAATLFPAETPIPRAALAAAGAAHGVEAADAAVARLLALGLLDDWGNAYGDPHAAANPLARPLAAAIEPADRPRLARAALPHLVKAWLDADGWFPADPRGVAAAAIALEAGAAPAVLEQAGFAGAAWYERSEGETRRALALIGRVIDALPPDYAANPDFLRLGVECADLLGEAGLLHRLLALPARQSPSGPTTAHAALDLRRAERLRRTGDVAGAETLISSAYKTALAARDERVAAMAAGQIADILQSRGELDEALRIRREEELPVYERLGDVRARAVAMGKIADILQAQGELDEALRILREEALPVFKHLGDVRARAVTMGKVADILQSRGELDEALRIRREEQLPVFERLGDARERALTMHKIAIGLIEAGGLQHDRIQEIYGLLAEAFALAQGLALPDCVGIIGVQLARILALGGHSDAALHVLDEAAAGFEKIGHAQGLAAVSELRAAIRDGRS